MTIGVDNVTLCTEDKTVDLSKYEDIEKKYVEAVDHKIDMIFTNDRKVADYFRDNKIPAFVEA